MLDKQIEALHHEYAFSKRYHPEECRRIAQDMARVISDDLLTVHILYGNDSETENGVVFLRYDDAELWAADLTRDRVDTDWSYRIEQQQMSAADVRDLKVLHW